MRFLRTEKGSTLLLVVITIAVLTVLGTTVLAMSYMNVNMKFTDERMKKTLYYSESGIEQVYSIVGKYIDLALEDASSRTESDLIDKEDAMSIMLDQLALDTSVLFSDEALKLASYADYETVFGTLSGMSIVDYMNKGLYLKILLAQGVVYDDYTTTFLRLEAEGIAAEIDVENALDPNRLSTATHQLIIDTDEIILYAKDQMNEYFKTFLDYEASNLETAITSVDIYLDDDATSANSEIEISFDPTKGHGNIVSYTEANSDINLVDDLMIIDGLTSTFNYKGRSRKSITTDIVIKTPGDLVPLELAQNKIVVANNPLWQYAIITHKDLTFNGSTSNITGNVYALGTNPSGGYDLEPSNLNSPRNSANYKGIMIAGSNANVDITGDVISQSYVQIAKGSTGARLTINDGHVYCNSFVVQEGSVNGAMYVANGNVYTRDDLELNGTNSTIDIDGSYYGFMGSAKEYNQTSAIVINSDLATSRLKITGNPASIIYPEDSGREGIFIAGVSYVNDTFTPDPDLTDSSTLYQSGESMGVKGNYIAYAFPTTDTTGDSANYNAVNLVIPPATGLISGLELYYKFNMTHPVVSKRGAYFTVEDKATYFRLISEDPSLNSIINTGGGRIDIDADDYQYTAGAVIGDVAGTPAVVVKNSNLLLVAFAEQEIARDYVYIMNTLKHRPSGVYAASTFFGAGEAPLNYITNSDTATVISNYSKIDTVAYNLTPFMISSGAVEGPSIAAADAREVAIVESDLSTPVGGTMNFLLIGAGSSYADADGSYKMIGADKYYVVRTDGSNSAEMQGVILTKGKVRISGDLTFYGSIIAMDEIYIEDYNIDIINNHIEVRKYLAGLVLTHPELNEVFDASTMSTLGFDLDQVEYIKDVVVKTGNTDSLRQNYNEFIYYQNWRIVE